MPRQAEIFFAGLEFGGYFQGEPVLHTTRILAFAAAAAFSSTTFAAEPINIKPGLWDVTQTITMSGAPLYVEGMNAASRAEYAKSWEKTANKPTTDQDQQCITARDIKEAHLFQDRSSAGKQCRQTVKKQTSTAWSASSECKDEKTTNVLELDYTAPSPDRFTGAVKSTLTSPNGKTVVDMKMSGKWVGASCPNEDGDDESEEDASSED
jgi:hypothetical protein